MAREFRTIALQPAATADAAIPIAASRAGAIGILDLSLVPDADAARPALAELLRLGRGARGLRLDAGRVDLLEELAAPPPGGIDTVLLAFRATDPLALCVDSLRRGGATILAEATTIDEARLAIAAGADGLVARGHEAGGRVGEETTFILLQRLLTAFELPVYAWGGIGLRTAAACRAAGAAGVVLDSQLMLAREARLPADLRAAIARMDGSETILLGAELGEPVRLYHRQGLEPPESLRRIARSLAGDARPRPAVLADWRRAVRDRAGGGPTTRHIWLLGQDAAFAAPLAARFGTVGGIIEGVRRSSAEHVAQAAALRPLDRDAPLAASHGTAYPIVQGPMTRVSDTAAFADAVAQGGALPFLALALMRAPQVRDLLRQTRDRLGDRPWGIGILGFVPLELREEQLAVAREFHPPFALIAGGRPDQALALEQDGTATYLHVPSPGLLRMFLESGARRFVFEGRECGGHVGPRSSFVLWESMVETLLAALPAGAAADCHVLFAGGIHDARSASMVAALAAPLAARGVRVGVLLGTAYLFTREAVESGAIVDGFQREAIRCDRTVLLETGPGHATRCTDSPYTRAFESERRRLLDEGREPEEMRSALEAMNLGRLRIASKGIDRHPDRGKDPGVPRYVSLDADRQVSDGMFMIGQLAALRSAACTIAELHRDVAVGGTRRLAAADAPAAAISGGESPRPLDIAIVGMSCLLPKSPGLAAFWRNILTKVDAITEVPAERWDWRRYYDAAPRARDRVYSRWGGFLEEIPFDPVRYGMPPSSLASIEPLQLLTLDVARAALEDAGYLDRPFDRKRASVILGAGGGVSDLGSQYAFRSLLPSFVDQPPEGILQRLPEWTEDSFPGVLLNVAAGRVANRFDLGGVNCTIDAACASSLAAVYLAAKELETGSSDMVIVGGADTAQNPFMYLCFSQTGAHSASGRCRTFDEKADGIAISEGIAVLVLKRLADAERDGDRIYAVLKAIAASSDGRDKGLTAPRPEGQALALERAYARAGFSPATVELIEAHGTGTVAGDQAEVTTLRRVFEAAGAGQETCAIGSVKSMIGHTKCTAGVAGMIKVALALHHRVLPPTLHVETPNPKAGFPDSPFYVNSETRPWLRRPGPDAPPRRAGVSAFGFGGTNFHAVLEEYGGAIPGLGREPVDVRPAELFLWRAASRRDLEARLAPVAAALAAGALPDLRDLAQAVWLESVAATADAGDRGDASAAGAVHLAVVATGPADLARKLAIALERLTGDRLSLHDPSGVYAGEAAPAEGGRLAILFPGQGSQYPGMLADLAIRFPEVRGSFEQAAAVLDGRLPQPLGRLVFPPPAFTPETEASQRRALTATGVAQPALGAAGLGMLRLLRSFGVRPDMTAGHSYGEYVALCAAGVFDAATLARLSEIRGRSIAEAAGEEPGTMAAVAGAEGPVADALQGLPEVWIANLNAPRQTVISGTRCGIEHAVERLAAAGMQARPIPVACAFHSPLVAPARDRLAQALAAVPFGTPACPVFANATAAPYPGDPGAIGRLLADHLVSPVRFADGIRAMHDAGARLFLEAGPRNVLTGLAQQTLEGREHLALATDQPGRSGTMQLLHVLAQLAVHGVPVDLEPLYPAGASLAAGAQAAAGVAEILRRATDSGLSPATWMVDGGRARPLAAPRAAAPTDRPARPAPDGPLASFPSAPTPAAPASIAQAPPAPQEVGASPAAGAAAAIVLEYQRLMTRFLETQQAVMQAYLQGLPFEAAVDRPVAPTDGAAIPAAVVPPGQAAETAAAPITVPPVAEQGIAAAPQGVAPTPAVAPAPVAAVPAPPARERLLGIVAERTGYPPEMLDLDLDIEADLGIDSIKRVEILGALQRGSGPEVAAHLQASMESLTRARTLRAILTITGQAGGGGPPAPAPRPGSATTIGGRPEEGAVTPASNAAATGPEIAASGDGHAEGHSGHEIPRFLTRLCPAPLPEEAGAAPRGVVLISEDDKGVAARLARELTGSGATPVLVGRGDAPREEGPGRFVADLADAAGAQALVELVRRRHGVIAGLVHLLPLGGPAGFETMTLHDWRERLRREVKSLYHLARAAAADLAQSATDGGAWLCAATSLGGGFAFDRDGGRPFFPGQGGVAGLVKTLAIEWPTVRCRVVDLDEADDATRAAARLLREMSHAAAGDRHGVEAAWSDGARRVPRPVAAPLMAAAGDDRPPEAALDGDPVILVTGGARGITAEVAIELAARHRPTLVLAGRSPFPPAEEAPATAGIEEPHRLKAALIETERGAGRTPQPAAIEAACRRLLADRDMRRNIEAMRRAGARVTYMRADMRDDRAVGALLADVTRRHGRIDGVIHGAGLIEDRLIEDKTPESFDRVFDTKADSAFLLARHLDPATLRFLVFFSSVAGRFGNRGQCDYAAANEVVNKLAVALDRRWPARVTAINWGPWAVTGMASPEVLRQFAERGVIPLPPAAGRAAAADEIARGRKGEIEVILGDGPWRAGSIAPTAAPADRLPLLRGVAPDPGGNGQTGLTRLLDPARDLYLLDHQLDGHPVLPAAVAIELMAEAALGLWPDWEVIGIESFRLMNGVVLENGPKPVRITARAEAQPDPERMELAVDVSISDPVSGRGHYRATVILGPALPAAPSEVFAAPGPLRPFPMSVAEAYERWLFHGPLFQGIEAFEGVCEAGIAATLRPSQPGRCVRGAGDGRWIFDPVVIDSAFQLTLLYARAHTDMTPLPARFRSLRRFAPVDGHGGRPAGGNGADPAPALRCIIQARTASGGHHLETQTALLDGGGRPRILLHDAEFTSSRDLNRLAGQWVRRAP